MRLRLAWKTLILIIQACLLQDCNPRLLVFKMSRLIGAKLPEVVTDKGGHGDGNHPEPDRGEPPDLPQQSRYSPLTYGKVFGAIPRVTGVNTPNINDRIAQKWGLPPVDNSEVFKKNYVEGREMLRYIFEMKLLLMI